jgi:VWFA-related protein
MQRLLQFGMMFLVAQMTAAQTAPPGTLQSTTTLVIVPTLVETPSGEPVLNLNASDFVVTDNGMVQAVSIEETERQPVAVVVLVQTGGAAERQFQNYKGLATMVDSLTGSSPRQVAMVTFDSRPEEASDFVTNVDELKEDLTHPAKGNGGAAILDAVNYGMDLLEKQPAGTRRILLLISQSHDDGSTVQADKIVRRLGETDTLICSLTFSPEKQWLKDEFTHERHENPLYEFSPGLPPLLHTFDLGKPIGEALQVMRKDTAAEIANLSGGESLPFGDRTDLDRQLAMIANHLPNRYTLTFRPTSSEPGIHAIKVQLANQTIAATVKARSSYWSSGPAQ